YQKLTPRVFNRATKCGWLTEKVKQSASRVGRVTPCAPQTRICSPNGAHGVTRPTCHKSNFICHGTRPLATDHEPLTTDHPRQSHPPSGLVIGHAQVLVHHLGKTA